MTVLRKDLNQEKISNINKLNSYFPIRTSSKDSSFDWEVAKGIVVRNIYKKQISLGMTKKEKGEARPDTELSLNRFKEFCREKFESRVDDMAIWPYIESMYFSKEAIYDLAPECLLFKLTSLSASSSKRLLCDLFSGLMYGFELKDSIVRMQRNFIENQVVEALRDSKVLSDYSEKRKRMSKGINEKPYLPFLTKFFQKDLELLSAHPRYLIDELGSLLKLYGYLYTAQLSLNIKGWQSEPSSKPLFFILEHETASKERVDLIKNGHKRVSQYLENIFPYLTMSESLQAVNPSENEHRLPLWELAQKLTADDVPALKKYAQEFAKDRNKDESYEFPYSGNDNDPKYWLDALLKLSLKQFDRGETRAAAQGKFINATERELCGDFVKSRGQAGKVLVMNQDYLVLLTNLAIGHKSKLQFYALLDEFNGRGVYFDKQSQQSLIRFYERLGNIERMSDSGDAVYVRKTI